VERVLRNQVSQFAWSLICCLPVCAAAWRRLRQDPYQNCRAASDGAVCQSLRSS
jgi:hypothetical protein